MITQTSFDFPPAPVPQLTGQQIQVLTYLMVTPSVKLGRGEIMVLRNLIGKGCVKAEMSVDGPALYRVTPLGKIARSMR